MPNLADAEREVSQVASSHGGTGGSCTPRGGYVPCAQQCAELSGDYSEHIGHDECEQEEMSNICMSIMISVDQLCIK